MTQWCRRIIIDAVDEVDYIGNQDSLCILWCWRSPLLKHVTQFKVIVFEMIKRGEIVFSFFRLLRVITDHLNHLFIEHHRSGPSALHRALDSPQSPVAWLHRRHARGPAHR